MDDLAHEEVLPVPVGPVTSSGIGVGARERTRRRRSRIADPVPQKNRPVAGGDSRSATARRTRRRISSTLADSSPTA